jgi:PAS domain S-box-containing protein
LQELKIKQGLKTEELQGRSVTIFLQQDFIVVSGHWDWTINSDAVFCSDVMLSLPAGFEGTKGIIHPDDLSQVKEQVMEEKIDLLEFRIITTYGEIKILTGEKLKVESREKTHELQAMLLEETRAELNRKKEIEELQLSKEIYEKLERYKAAGIWWYNNSTNETWYSAQVFRIYELPPQSLNAHLNTFTEFIHPEDKETVIEFMDKASRQQTPLHLEYRIRTAKGDKWVLLITQWSLNQKGETILSGLLEDVTEQKAVEQKLEEAENAAGFLKQQLWFDEQNANIGHWQVSLLTRKTVYSDHYYRIFGLRAQGTAAGINGIINYVHPEDRELVKLAHKKMLYEHSIPELEYRIIRTDGKLRYIVQKAKMVTYENEMVMAGTIQDVTVQRTLEQKLKQLQKKETRNSFSHRKAEELADISHWVWDLRSGEISWSENLYRLIGLKPNAPGLTIQRLLLFIHPDDKKRFTDELTVVVQQRQEIDFDFRLVYRGEVKNMKASFRLLSNDEEDLFIGTVQDLTKEYLLQHQLNQQVQLAEALSQNILDKVIITDLGNTVLLWNRACEESYGLKKEEAVGKNFFDVFPQLKTAEELSLFNKVLKGESVCQKESRSIFGKGYYDLHLIPLWDEEQMEVNGIIHIVHDTTKELELRQNLSERLSFIENLVESSVDRIIALDRNMKYLVWNKKCEEHYGLKKAQVIGKNVLEVFPDTQNTPAYEEFRKVLRGETVYLPANKESGKENYHEVYLIPVKNDNGEIIAVLWILHDLSKEFELATQRERTSGILDALNEGYIELDTEQRFLYINPVGCAFFNKEEKEIIGKKAGELFPPFVDSALHIAVTEVLEKGEPVRGEFRSPVNRKWIFVSIAPSLHGVNILFHDIQGVKEADKAIREREYLLQQINNATPDAITIYNLESRTPAYLNDALANWLGYSPGEMIEMGYEKRLEMIHPHDRHKLVSLNETIGDRPDDELTTIQYRIRTKDGRQLWLRNRVRVFKRNAEGKATHTLTVLQDVTEQVMVKKKILKDGRRYLLRNKIYEYAEDIANLGTWTWNIDLNKAYFSDNMFLLFGMEPKEVQPDFDTIPKFIHPEDRNKLIQLAAEIREGEEPRSVEFRVIRKDGVERTFRNRCKLVYSEKGYRLLLGVTQDITEEIGLRQQLTDRTLYAEALIESSIDRIMVLDPGGYLVGWNRRCEEIYNLKKEQTIGKHFFDIFARLKEDAFVVNALNQSVKGETIYLPVRKEKYTNSISELFYIPIKNEKGEVLLVLHIVHDITKMFLAREELREINKTLEQKNILLEQKNEEITNFAFISSHDLKEPLRKIHTFSDWLMEKEKEGLSATGKKFIERISASVKRMELLIDDILVLTHINSEKNPNKEISLGNVFQKVTDDLKEQIKEKDAVIEVGPLPKIRGHENQLFYLLKNLVHNGIKFQEQGNKPKLSIHAEVVEVNREGSVEEKPYIRLCITDNGLGFDEKYAKKIFQVFQRLHGKTEFEGTGIGLAICRKIMENHNGFIKAESIPGKGSTFCCYFPFV